MRTKSSETDAQRYALLAIFLFAPLGLGAKGCNSAVVGDDPGQCTTNCMGEGGAETGGTAGTSGSSGTGGKGGSSGTSGKGGSAGTAGSMTGTGGSNGGKGGGDTGGSSGTAGTSGTSTGGSSGTAGTSDTGGSSGTAGASGTGGDAVCGGLRGSSCADGQYCNFPIDAQCGAADQTGTCATIPEVCDQVYAPVCGCDGMTYSNDCTAAGAGVSVASTGECDEPLGDDCGGLTGAVCKDGEFCNYAPDAQCGAADQTGTCELIPSGCTKEYAPVCGCDGITYGNECTAHAAGVSVASSGECGTTPDFCGGIAGFTCPDGMFCDFPIEAMCGAGDMTGTCSTMPGACTQEYAPVCGCDDMTYGNACTARGAGVSVQYEGECTK